MELQTVGQKQTTKRTTTRREKQAMSRVVCVLILLHPPRNEAKHRITFWEALRVKTSEDEGLETRLQHPMGCVRASARRRASLFCCQSNKKSWSTIFEGDPFTSNLAHLSRIQQESSPCNDFQIPFDSTVRIWCRRQYTLHVKTVICVGSKIMWTH